MSDRDRGQLLLVAALGLAVAFLALAVVLNAVVFTENLATRNHGRGDDAVAFENAVENGVGGLLAETNHYNNTDYGELGDALRRGVGYWDANTTLLSAATGSVTNTTVAGVTNGTQVLQSENRTFTDAEGDGDWTVAPGVTGTRRFRVVVTPESTTEFRVVVSDGAASWRVAVSENSSNAEYTDVVVRNDTAVLHRVTVEANTVVVDVTQGVVTTRDAASGTRIENWTYADGVSTPYDISFENGAAASGKYVLVVDRTSASLVDDVPSGTYEPRGTDDYPTAVPALYSANVSVTVRRSTFTYETTVAVAPASPPGGEDYAVAGGPPVAEGVLFVDEETGELMLITRTKNTTIPTTDSVTSLGPMTWDFDGDGVQEIPYVNASGALRLVDALGYAETWRTSAASHPPETTPSRLAVGAWNGSAVSVLYPNDLEDGVYAAADATGPSTRLHHPDSGVEAVAGVADIDGDGEMELVYGSTSQQLRYRDDDGTDVKIQNGGYGKNHGPGIGRPADFDGDGVPRVPFVGTSNNLKLVDADGNVVTVVSGNVAKAAIAVDDWDDDGTPEIIFVNTDGELRVVDDVTGTPDVSAISGDLDGDGEPGVDVDPTVGVV